MFPYEKPALTGWSMYNLSRHSAIQDEVRENRDIHVRIVVPGHRVQVDSGALVIDATWSILLKQSNHAGSSGLIKSVASK
jgi:hypothetical protein